MIQKYKKVSNEYQKAVKSFNMEHEKSFLQNNNAEKIYCYVNSKLKIGPVFSVLQDENNLLIVFDFEKASFLIEPFKRYLLKVKKKVLTLLIKPT